MKSEFAFIALPISALVAPSTFAVQYLTVDQAQRAIFPGKSLTAAPVKLAPAQRKAIEQVSGVRVLHEVVGKHEFITYAVGLNANGSVKQIEVMDYRETYGGEIRNETWRAQFVGKTSQSPLKLDRDIKNISGATLSCRHVTDGVKRLLAFYEIALKRS
jgi:Na+-translocating ferredoxin:NAD+ oxidoreductase RnfG subunit